jgi:hypothetical protein
MTYTQAVEEIAKGSKVKLPEWQGYWFKDSDEQLKVLNKEGKMVACSQLLSCANRTDWEISQGTRDFGGALIALKAGSKVSRKAWNGCYIFILQGQSYSTSELNEDIIKDVALSNGGLVTCLPTIRIKTSSNKVLTGWNPNLIEIFAEDWYIVD